MRKGFAKLLAPLIFVSVELCADGALAAQETIQTPSQSTREAMEKFSRTPGAIGKTLQGVTDAARERLQQSLSGKPASATKAEAADLDLLQKKSEAPVVPRVSLQGKRDPFRPMTLGTKTSSQPRENLSPLERFELGQLKVVGIIWDIKEPRAMIEDSAGLGYIVRVGTPIGSNEGKVKGIHRSEIVVEEFHTDFHGNKMPRDISMKLPAE